ncbi:hypothetical protein J2Z76_002298 [Sedimentibacter acidaminivorans]|uniref:Uncharacterized protein n=1 Tax=Sedimentibacter acidaminivorans TaxID=913099 RepID=A0ABS4GFG8_9FIRM|nr:hypothetical protein [Sedimentibacter acidaminivorans]MBP1926433.1 hypothetical protein [Sedimentibacter acidaminivorans]
MSKLKYKIIHEGILHDIFVPMSAVFIDYADVKACGLTMLEACEKIAATIPGPAGYNMFDMTATTTNSDGVMIDGSMTCMAASDYGKINKDFGYLEMVEVTYSEELIQAEPHLKQWKKSYPDRRLIMGPDPKKKKIPIHNAVLTGRAGNNNSATEMMHYITMEEILYPITGQLQIMKDGKVEVGGTGHIISVGIGMVVGEEYGRIVPHRQFRCGSSAHNSGEYAKYLKSHIPVIAADKSELAKYIIQALQTGVIPGRDIGASPAVLSVARHMKIKPDFDNMTKASLEELADVGFTKEWITADVEELTPQEIIAKAHEIIPGIDNPTKFNVSDVVQVKYIEV